MVQAEVVVEAPVQCCHHWVIESPSGPISRGVCRRCGATRVFSNAIAAAEWDVASVTELDDGDWTALPLVDLEAKRSRQL